MKNLNYKKAYKRGSIISKKGEKSYYLFFIEKGIVDKLDGNTIVKTYYQGDYFDLLYINEAYEYNYIAQIDSNIVLLEINNLDYEYIYNLIKKEAISLEKTKTILELKTPIKKISKYLIIKYKETNSLSLTIPYTRKRLSDYLGLSEKDLKDAIKYLTINNTIATKGYIYNIINLSFLISLQN